MSEVTLYTRPMPSYGEGAHLTPCPPLFQEGGTPYERGPPVFFKVMSASSSTQGSEPVSPPKNGLKTCS